MPGYSVSIKERMLYSSCKNSVVDVLEKVYSIIVNKKIEVDTGAELTEEYLLVRAITQVYNTYIQSCVGRAPSYQKLEQTEIFQASSAKQRQ